MLNSPWLCWVQSSLLALCHSVLLQAPPALILTLSHLLTEPDTGYLLLKSRNRLWHREGSSLQFQLELKQAPAFQPKFTVPSKWHLQCSLGRAVTHRQLQRDLLKRRWCLGALHGHRAGAVLKPKLSNTSSGGSSRAHAWSSMAGGTENKLSLGTAELP